MADVICPASIIILNSVYIHDTLFPHAEIGDNLHASLNMFRPMGPIFLFL